MHIDKKWIDDASIEFVYDSYDHITKMLDFFYPYRKDNESKSEYDKRKTRLVQFYFPDNKVTVLRGMVKIKGDTVFSPNMLDEIYASHEYGMLPFDFEMGEVDGNFVYSKLSSLKGSPSYVQNDFNCSGNNLDTLVGGPHEVMGSYHCSNTYITDLIGSPKVIGKDLNCRDCYNLSSFNGLGEIGSHNDGYVHVLRYLNDKTQKYFM